MAAEESRLYQCDVCQFTSNYEFDLIRHQKLHTNDKRYVCEVCSYGFKKASHLKRHMMIHTGEKPFKCDICQYSTNQKSYLKKHRMIHTGDTPQVCDICSFRTNMKAEFERHQKAHTSENPYVCDLCKYSTCRLRALQLHMMTHTGEKVFKCDICHYRTNHKSQLKMHQMMHTGEKPFKCDICPYRTNNFSSLKRHVVCKKHQKNRFTKEEVGAASVNDTEVKFYVCDFCEYSTNKQGELKRHQKTHTGKNSYLCDLCKYSTNNLTALKTHMMIHTGEKPFKCNMCQYSTNEKSQLKKHGLVHSGEKPYKCDICKYRTSRPYDLKKHKLSMHKRDKPLVLVHSSKDILLQDSPNLIKSPNDQSDNCSLTKIGQSDHDNVAQDSINQIVSFTTNERISMENLPVTEDQCNPPQLGDQSGCDKVGSNNPNKESDICSDGKSDSSPFPNVKSEQPSILCFIGEKEIKFYQCKFCQYITPAKSDVINHEKRHTSNSSYRYEGYQYSTDYKEDLQRHNTIHKTEKPKEKSMKSYPRNNRNEVHKNAHLINGASSGSEEGSIMNLDNGISSDMANHKNIICNGQNLKVILTRLNIS